MRLVTLDHYGRMKKKKILPYGSYILPFAKYIEFNAIEIVSVLHKGFIKRSIIKHVPQERPSPRLRKEDSTNHW